MSKFFIVGIVSFSILNAFLWYLTSHGGSFLQSSSGAVDEHLHGFRVVVRPDVVGGAARRSQSQLLLSSSASTAVSNATTASRPSSGSSSSSSSSTNSSTSTSTSSFSACLLIKDDNDLLNEWLAYHYYTLDLRYVVLAVDPSSQTSPKSILDKWKHHTDLRFTLWKDRDYMPARYFQQEFKIRPKLVKNDKWHEGHEDPETIQANYLRISNHRFRQLTFLSACLNHMRRRNRTLVMHIDTDEYVTLNPKLRRLALYRNHPMPIWGSEPGAIATFVRSVLYQDEYLFDKSNLPCLSMPRLLFGSVEDPNADTTTAAAASNDALWATFNRTTFETQRWMYHASYNDSDRNAQPKVIVDVSRVSHHDQMLSGRPFSIHRPSRQLCRWMDQMVLTGFQRYPLVVHHYLGTWERYEARNDTRRSSRLYHNKAHVQAGKDKWIAAWLNGFVRTVGDEKARILLDRHLLVSSQ